MAEVNTMVGDIPQEPVKSVTTTSVTTFPYDELESYGGCDSVQIDINESFVQVFGTEEQRVLMFKSLSEYFLEVENPENTVVNTFFKAKYSPLNEVLNTIRPVLGKYGLGVIQVPTFDNTNCAVNTILTHSAGAMISFPALKNKPTKGDVQGMGSTLTYLRRFALNAIAGVMGEVDDDGNAATGSGGKESTAKQDNAKKPETTHDKLSDLCRAKMAEAKKAGRDQEMRSKLDEITKGIKCLTEEEAQTAIDEVSKL